MLGAALRLSLPHDHRDLVYWVTSHDQLVSDTYELLCYTIIEDKTPSSLYLTPPHTTLLIRVDKQGLIRLSDGGVQKESGGRNC